MRRVAIAVLISASIALPPLNASAIEPLSFVAAGVLTSTALDKAEAKVQQLISGAAGAASLVVSKAARDAELLIAAAREQVRSELETNWDRLGAEKLSILREVDASIQRAEKLAAAGGRLEDAIVLDIGAAIDRLTFSSTAPIYEELRGRLNTISQLAPIASLSPQI